MNRFATALSAGFIALVIVSCAGFVPIAAEAATGKGLKAAAASCKSEAKGKKMGWFARRKFVKSCVARTVKLTPDEIAKIALKEAIIGCNAEAKGKKVRWLARRKFVKACVTASLKHYSLDVSEVRNGVNIRGLRTFTPQELGCNQYVFC